MKRPITRTERNDLQDQARQVATGLGGAYMLANRVGNTKAASDLRKAKQIIASAMQTLSATPVAVHVSEPLVDVVEEAAQKSGVV